jgi:hypothetical protein
MNRIIFVTIIILFTVLHLQAQESWYKCLNGTIDKYAVTMYLHKTAHTYSGYYFYNSKEDPIYFIGDDTTISNKIKLLAFPVPVNEGDETFIIEGDSAKFTGEWKKNNSSDGLSFSATESSDTSLIPFSLIYTSGEKKLKPSWKESPAATYAASVVWPANNTAKALFVKKIISGQLTQKGKVEEPEIIFSKNKDKFFKEYEKEYRDVEDSMLKHNPYTFSVDETKRLIIVYQSSKILSVANYSYAYAGGAHGNYGTNYLSLDLVNKRRLLLTNILTRGGEARLPALLEKYFREYYKVDMNTSLAKAGLFDSTIQPNDNFFVTTKGINFSYTPYEIGPYAMGEINIFIPLTELNNYLQPSFKSLIK